MGAMRAPPAFACGPHPIRQQPPSLEWPAACGCHMTALLPSALALCPDSRSTGAPSGGLAVMGFLGCLGVGY